MGTFLSAAFSAILSWVTGLFESWWSRREAKAEGKEAQQARDVAEGEQTEAAMGQAEAQAPRTQAELESRLKKGTF